MHKWELHWLLPYSNLQWVPSERTRVSRAVSVQSSGSPSVLVWQREPGLLMCCCWEKLSSVAPVSSLELQLITPGPCTVCCWCVLCFVSHIQLDLPKQLNSVKIQEHSKNDSRNTGCAGNKCIDVNCRVCGLTTWHISFGILNKLLNASLFLGFFICKIKFKIGMWHMLLLIIIENACVFPRKQETTNWVAVSQRFGK